MKQSESLPSSRSGSRTVPPGCERSPSSFFCLCSSLCRLSGLWLRGTPLCVCCFTGARGCIHPLLCSFAGTRPRPHPFRPVQHKVHNTNTLIMIVLLTERVWFFLWGVLQSYDLNGTQPGSVLQHSVPPSPRSLTQTVLIQFTLVPPGWTIKQLPLVEDLQPDSWEPLSVWVDEPCLIFTTWLYKVNPEERNVMNTWRGFYSSCKETGNTGKHLSVQWSNRTQDSNMEQNTSPDPSKHKSGWQTINQYNVSSM